MSKRLNLFRYCGGKFYLLDVLLELIPNHICYVEVFGGAGSLLLNKPKSKIEVFNDIDKNIYALFKVLSDKELAYEFKERIQNYFYSRDIFNECKENLKRDNLPYIDKAISFYYVANCCYGGKLITPAFGYSKVTNRVKIFRNKVEKIVLFIDRLKDVLIENIDFEDLINRYDSCDTFFYCDPPYDLNRSSRAYEHPWSEDYEKRLVDCLLKIKGKVLLTVYDNDTYNRLTEYGWQKKNVTVFNSIAGRLRRKDSTHRNETIYMNYEQEKQEEIDLREDIKDDRRSAAACNP